MVKILIVEDNKKNLELFSLLINPLGYTIITAVNGEDGVLKAEKELPDLILMDIQMPVMDGITAFKLLKKDDNLKNIPIIALTSYAMVGDRERLIEIGFTDYISKPIRTQSFLDMIQKYIG
ncbi:MAG: response regulator [Promethearchaeota archaeon]